jgi:zinc transport system substrate-binding protein
MRDAMTVAPIAAGHWKRAALRLLPLLLAGALVVGLALLLRPDAGPTVPLAVTATVPPQAWLVRRLGGERVTVEVLLPPGADVHTYETTPQQVQRLDAARLIVEVGHPALPLERQLLAHVARRSPAPEIVSMAAAGRALGVAIAEDDPHLWLSPAVMSATARGVAAALARLDPPATALYERNLASLLAEVDAVDAEVRHELASLPQRRFLVYHPSWGCFAQHYGLEQVAIEADGKEPSARRLVALVEQARADGTRAVFVQEGVADRPARVLAAELGAAVVPLDALAEDWPATMRLAAARLREALDG